MPTTMRRSSSKRSLLGSKPFAAAQMSSLWSNLAKQFATLPSLLTQIRPRWLKSGDPRIGLNGITSAWNVLPSISQTLKTGQMSWRLPFAPSRINSVLTSRSTLGRTPTRNNRHFLATRLGWHGLSVVLLQPGCCVSYSWTCCCGLPIQLPQRHGPCSELFRRRLERPERKLYNWLTQPGSAHGFSFRNGKNNQLRSIPMF
mmetsp:Transcript_71216/g.148936  ORF Transcript_71216/g.148936 Transcript_71216/m.148936 type:complete len:201 (+) Transcript_71216:1250-1852(+)